jgi:hypothetical protein
MFAIYPKPWHDVIFDFIDLRKNHGKEEARARDLLYTLWIPVLRRLHCVSWLLVGGVVCVKRVEANGNWSLLCLDEVPGVLTSMVPSLRLFMRSGINKGGLCLCRSCGTLYWRCGSRPEDHSWFTGVLLMVGLGLFIVQCYTNHDCFAAKLNRHHQILQSLHRNY